MADKRYNPATSFVGGGYSAGPHMQPTQGVPGMVPYMQAGMPINNMMQQQMMMAPGLRFPIQQGMRMGPPNTPPPPYSAHNTTAAMPTRPRASLNKAKEGGQQSEKERFFEEQRRKLQQFGRPGSVKVDEGKLIGSIFSADTKMATSKGKAAATQSADDDDGFGDFLQGPSLQQSAVKKEERKVTHESVEVIAPGPETKPQEEKKDLASIMLEYSDLSAPKKAKGFHKPTLNEVQKSGHIDTHRLKGSSFHESDHARSWKMQAEDLEGLFQLPAKAKKSPPAPLPTHSPQLVHAAVPAGAVIPPGEHVIAFGTGSTVMSPPLGPPPSYSEVVSPTALASPTNFMTTNHVSPAFSQPFTGSHSTNHVSPAVGQPFSGSHIANHVGPAVSQPFTTGHTNRSLTLPEWCTHNEEQMPPVYKHVWEASLVDNKISTERLYPILLLSGLPREKLAHIWSLCNTATPGQLVKHELWLILAMIALTQHQYNTNTMDILVECPVAPVPALATAQDTGPPATLPTTPMQHQVYTAHTPAATVPPVAGVVQMSPPNNVHRVQQPRPQLVTPAARGHSTLAPEDDDFTDFQAAIPAMSSVGKGSLFGDDISTTSTPSKSRGLDTQSLGDQLSSSSFSEQESTIGWVHESSGVDSHWASFGASDSYEPPGFTASPNDSQVNKLSSSGTAVTAGMFDTTLTSSLPGVVPNTSSRWDVLPQSPSLSSTSSHGYTNPQNIDPPGGFSSQTGQEDEWSSFSSAQAKAGAADEEGDLSGEAKFVTIKKQNLGTSEIMGVFKVRDDPATLSSYQLPPQASVNKNMARNTHHPPGAGHGYRMPSDDDMGPPPLDFSHDEDEDEHTFSRGYDFDDVIHQGPPATIYSPFGLSHSSPLYSHAGANRKLKENREDSGSVHSLDLPSNKQSDHYGSDSVSLSSTDLNGSEINGGGTGVVSAESKSLDSLDLKNDAADSEHSYSAKDDVQASSTHHPIQPQELLSSMPDFADKYNIQHEAQGSDRYGHYWEHCLSNCCRVIAEANTLFNTISSSSVCNEVLKSSQGSGYVTSVVEIYRVVCRIMTSMRSTAISTSELEQTVKDIDLAWNNLTAFLVGASLLPEQSTLVFSNCVLKSDSDHAKQLACGVCLLNVDTNPFNSGAGINSCKLTYAGRQYHATCANFWVNCVDQTLPSLTLPELL
ncbi:synergin gamma-like isoform X3 [Physella acuta]|uniref:synergin gamma-like isoform X3 n=1 Tax=Physella acuta TaxID=109671 RepID=UPI0027DE9504|nr:synergin gamma-like isoform X3 [Physella acuta]